MQCNKTGCVVCPTLEELCHKHDCPMLCVACTHLVVIVVMLLAFAYTWLPIGKSICGSNTFAKHGRFAELCRNCMQSQHNLLLKMNVVRVIYTVATMVQGRLSGSSAILQAPLTPIRFWSMNQPGAVSLSQLLMVHFRPCSQTRLSVTVCQVHTSYALLLVTW